MNNSGVYQYQHKDSGKRYVGSAVDLRHRRRSHESALRRGDHYNPHFQRAFEFKVILYCTPEDCIRWEQRALDEYQTSNRRFGYNVSPTAGSSLGVVRSDEYKRRVSEGMTGLERTTEHRTNLSKALKGRQFSDETRQKMSEAAVRRGAHSAEANAKGAAKRTGSKRTEETKANMKAAQLLRRQKERNSREWEEVS